MTYLVTRIEMLAQKAFGGSMLAFFLLMLSVPLLAAAAEPASLPARILITNVNIFDGKGYEFKRVTDATANLYRRAKQFGVKLAFGSDLLFNPPSENQGAQLARLGTWFSPAEVLKIGTSQSAGLLELSGPRHPYREGKLGVIAEGAYADLILVDGNPLEDLELIADPEMNFKLIMKDGRVYKNTL